MEVSSWWSLDRHKRHLGLLQPATPYPPGVILIPQQFGSRAFKRDWRRKAGAWKASRKTIETFVREVHVH